MSEGLQFPSPESAVDGLVAIGGDLGEQRLLQAYRMGIFPWYSEDEPILWWSPDPRLVLLPGELHVSHRLERILKHRKFRITFDHAFEKVIAACASIARPGKCGTWIMPEMIEAYCSLNRSGYAHSVECWVGRRLAGGLYGVSLGACFFGESMFARESDASKVALAALVQKITRWDFSLIDCQVDSPHLRRLGAREIPRSEFLDLLKEALQKPTYTGNWGKDYLPVS